MNVHEIEAYCNKQFVAPQPPLSWLINLHVFAPWNFAEKHIKLFIFEATAVVKQFSGHHLHKELRLTCTTKLFTGHTLYTLWSSNPDAKY